MRRKKELSEVPLSIRTTQTERKQLEELAEYRGLSITGTVRYLIKKGHANARLNERNKRT